MMKAARSQAGFGMLEAVVALVLFAMVGSTLFAWINTNLDAAARLRQRDRAQALVQIAAAWMQTRNPLAEPNGESEIEPGTRVRWRARPLTPVTPGAPLPGGTVTPFRLALFEVEVTVSSADNGEAHFVLTRVGVDRDPLAELQPGQ